MIHRLVSFEVRREAAQQARDALAAFADEVGRKEGGTAFFHAYEEQDAPGRFHMLMAFRVASAAQYHDGTAWAKRFRDALAPLVTQPLQTRALAPLGKP